MKARGAWLLPLGVGLAALLVPVISVALAGYFQGFDGRPAIPTPMNVSGWDQVIHQRDDLVGNEFGNFLAHHGPDCSGFPNTHVVTTYEAGVFLCNDHLMTAIDSGFDNYAVIYLTPNQLMDFSSGTAVLDFDLSTLRTSTRDWVDVWLTPYDQHTQVPLEDNIPDGQGPPRNALQISGRDTAINRAGQLVLDYSVYVHQAFQRTEVAPLNDPQGRVGVEDALASANPPQAQDPLKASAVRRDTFELQVSRTHVKFGMPAYNFWFVDRNIADLGYGQAVVQLGHHSYTPVGKCSFPQDLCTAPNTWHWDNVSINPSVPFTILRASPRMVNVASTDKHLTWGQPAPANALLKFSAAIGVTTPRVSFDEGATWQTPGKPQTEFVARGATDFTHPTQWQLPVPSGATRALVSVGSTRGWIEDAAVYSSSASGGGGGGGNPPTATATPSSTPTLRPSSTPTSTSTSIPIPTATPTSIAATATATASPSSDEHSSPTSTTPATATATPVPTSEPPPPPVPTHGPSGDDHSATPTDAPSAPTAATGTGGGGGGGGSHGGGGSPLSSDTSGGAGAGAGGFTGGPGGGGGVVPASASPAAAPVVIQAATSPLLSVDEPVTAVAPATAPEPAVRAPEVMLNLPRVLAWRNVSVVVPATMVGAGFSLEVLPAAIDDDGQLLLDEPGTFRYGSTVFRLAARDVTGQAVFSLPSTFDLWVVPSAEDLALVDGEPTLLNLEQRNPESDVWNVVPSTFTTDGAMLAQTDRLLPD